MIALLTSLAACAGDGPPSSTPGSEYGQIQRTIFDRSCNSSSCHSTATRSGDLSLAAHESYAELVGVPPNNTAAFEKGLLLVAPDDVAASFLVAKVTGDLGDFEGVLMPIGEPALSPDEIAMIELWIENGAQPDSEPPTED